MKGISTILAMILIVIIVVALIGLTYTFAVNLFTTTSTATTSTTEETLKRLDKHVSFVGEPTCKNISNKWVIRFTIRHDGAQYKIEKDELSVIFDDEIIVDTEERKTGDSIEETEINPGKVKSFNFTNSSVVDWSGTKTLIISAPAATATKTIDCPKLS